MADASAVSPTQQIHTPCLCPTSRVSCAYLDHWVTTKPLNLPCGTLASCAGIKLLLSPFNHTRAREGFESLQLFFFLNVGVLSFYSQPEFNDSCFKVYIYVYTYIYTHTWFLSNSKLMRSVT